MKATKFRELDTAELAGSCRKRRSSCSVCDSRSAMGQTEGLKRYRELRKDRARMLTILRERELDPAKAQAAAEAAASRQEKWREEKGQVSDGRPE